MKTIRMIDSEGWKMEKDFDNEEELFSTLINANVKNKRGYMKVMTDYDGSIITIKSVPKDDKE